MSKYVPFGEEWQKEVMKLPKRAIVDMLARARLEIQAHEAAQQSVQSDGWVCTCKFPSPANDRMGEYCRLCGKPTRR